MLVEELGEKGWILETCIRYYPACRYTAGPVDMLRRLMREQGLNAEDIEKIEIRMHPMGYALRIFQEPPKVIATDYRAALNGAFNISYVMVLAALGRTPGPRWYSEKNLKDPEIWKLAARIVTAEDESARDDVVCAFRETRTRRFRKTSAAMSVWVSGEEHRCDAEYADGDPWTPKPPATWDSVEQKFQNFCSRLMPSDEIRGLIDCVRNLESVSDVSRELTLPLVAA